MEMNSRYYYSATQYNVITFLYFLYHFLEPKLLNFSWLLVILHRAMSHESKLLNKWALQYFLQIDLKKFPLLSETDHQFIFVHLKTCLNSTFLYEREENSTSGDPPVLFTLLFNFFGNCVELLDHNQQLRFSEKVSISSLFIAHIQQYLVTYFYLSILPYLFQLLLNSFKVCRSFVSRTFPLLLYRNINPILKIESALNHLIINSSSIYRYLQMTYTSFM